MKTARVPLLPRRAALLALSCACMITTLSVPTHAQDKGAPPWGEFLKRFEKDKLLKLPYYMEEETTPKGLASKIRARELDVPNRIKAIEYLASLDCAQFPEAKEMLILVLQNDQWERVRLAAAKGLRDMLERNACGDSKGNGNGNCRECQSSSSVFGKAKDYCLSVYSSAKGSSKGSSKKAEKAAAAAEDCRCRNCCDADTLNALSEIAYGKDERGCFNEPSERVREMVIEAMDVCGIECRYPTYAPVNVPVPVGPPPIDPEGNVPMLEGTADPDLQAPPVTEGDAAPGETEVAPAPVDAVQIPELPTVTSFSQPVQPTPIEHLNKICIVSWRDGTRVKPDPAVTSVYKGRIYQFANADCKSRFEASPEDFAVAFGGCDPVQFVKTREAATGRYLVDHEGKFYMFTSLENLDEFNAHPEVYTLAKKAIVRASASE